MAGDSVTTQSDDPVVFRFARIVCDVQLEMFGAPPPEEHPEAGLGRHLGLVSSTLLIVSSMVGTGIFSVPSSIVGSTGSVGAALLLWVFGFVLAFCGLWVWLEWGCLYPRSGGEKVYLNIAYPRPRLLALTLFTIQAVFLSTPAAGCIVFAENFTLAIGYDAPDRALKSIAVSTIFFIATMHAVIPRIGVRIMDSASIVQIAMLIALDITGIYVLIHGTKTVPDPRANFRSPFQGSSHDVYDYAIALLKIMQTYYGWSYPAYVLNEIKNPVRTLKRAGPIGLGTVGALYILANVAYFTVGTPREIAESGVTVATLFLGKLFGKVAEKVAAALVSVSALGFVMAHSFAMARVNQELAKEGMLPFGYILASNWPAKAPMASLMLVFFVTTANIVAIPFGDAYNFIMDIMAYPAAIMSFSVTLGLLILRRRDRELERPFTVWIPVALLFLFAQGFLIISPFIRPRDGKGDTNLPYWLAPFASLMVVLGGLFIWWIWRIVIPYTGYFQWVSHERTLADGTVVHSWRKGRIV